MIDFTNENKLKFELLIKISVDKLLY